MDCKLVQKMIDGYFDGELSDSVRERIDEHLNSCDACKEQFTAQEKISAAMKVLSKTPAPDSLYDKVSSAIRHEKEKTVNIKTRKLKPAVFYKRACLLAACVLLFVVVQVGVWHDTTPDVSYEDARAYYEATKHEPPVFMTPKREKKTDESDNVEQKEQSTPGSTNNTAAVEYRAAIKPVPQKEENKTETAKNGAQSAETETDAVKNDVFFSVAEDRIIVRSITFKVAAADEARAKELLDSAKTETQAEDILLLAGIAYEKEVTAKDKTQDYQMLNLLRQSIEASINNLQARPPLTDEEENELLALYARLDDCLSDQKKLIEQNEGTVIEVTTVQP